MFLMVSVKQKPGFTHYPGVRLQASGDFEHQQHVSAVEDPNNIFPFWHSWLIAISNYTVVCVVICDYVQQEDSFETLRALIVWHWSCVSLCCRVVAVTEDWTALGSGTHSGPTPPALVPDRRPLCGVKISHKVFFSCFNAANTNSYHSASLEAQLLFPCHRMDSVAATLSFLPVACVEAQWQLMTGEFASPVLAAEGGGLLCLCGDEGVPTACGMQRWECWTRGLPKGRGGEGGVEERRGGGKKRGLTFEQCRQEVMTQFSSRAVKHRTKKWKQRTRWREWVERWCLRPRPWEISS